MDDIMKNSSSRSNGSFMKDSRSGTKVKAAAAATKPATRRDLHGQQHSSGVAAAAANWKQHRVHHAGLNIYGQHQKYAHLLFVACVPLVAKRRPS